MAASLATRRATSRQDLSPRGTALPSVRHDHRSRGTGGTRTAPRTGAPAARQEAPARRVRERAGHPRAASLPRAPRFCLGAFVYLGWALEEGDELPFAFEEHVQRRGRALRVPAARALVHRVALDRAGAREDAGLALTSSRASRRLRSTPARTQARARPRSRRLFRTVLARARLDGRGVRRLRLGRRHFERAYAELESLALRRARAYAAVAPLVGLSVGADRARRRDCAVRAAATGELARTGPRRAGCSRRSSAARPTAYCVLELERGLERR